jgi:hypothetical protein
LSISAGFIFPGVGNGQGLLPFPTVTRSGDKHFFRSSSSPSRLSSSSYHHLYDIQCQIVIISLALNSQIMVCAALLDACAFHVFESSEGIIVCNRDVVETKHILCGIALGIFGMTVVNAEHKCSLFKCPT